MINPITAAIIAGVSAEIRGLRTKSKAKDFEEAFNRLTTYREDLDVTLAKTFRQELVIQRRGIESARQIGRLLTRKASWRKRRLVRVYPRPGQLHGTKGGDVWVIY